MLTDTGKILLFLILLPGMLFLAAGCNEAPPPAAEDGAVLEVVATIFPLADLAGRLGGEKVAVSCLLPAGSSPHAFEPTTDQVKRSFRADLFFYIGAGLDDWAVKIAGAGPGDLIVMGLAEAALQRGWNPQQEQQTGEALNPHLWLDPLAVRDYLCPAITEALVEADRQNEDYYRANLAAYQRELTSLDKEIRALLGDGEKKGFISVHAAWLYFAARYDLNQAAVISDFPGQEPSAAWVSGLIDLCRSHHVRVVAAEPQLSTAAAEMIAHEIDGRVILLDPLGGAGLSRRDNFLDLMRYNTEVLRDAFLKK